MLLKGDVCKQAGFLVSFGQGVPSVRLREINLSLADAQLPQSTNSSVPIKRTCGGVIVCQAPHAATFLKVFQKLFFLSVGLPLPNSK